MLCAQRIEAPVRGGEGAPGQIPDGGPPVAERLGQIDQILINNDGADERAILGNGLHLTHSQQSYLFSAFPFRITVAGCAFPAHCASGTSRLCGPRAESNQVTMLRGINL